MRACSAVDAAGGTMSHAADHDLALSEGLSAPVGERGFRRWSTVAARQLTPGIAARIYYLARYGALVSRRAEVPISGQARWGRGCVISSFTKIKIDGPFEMGARVQVATNCFIGVSSAGLVLGDDVLVSPNCSILTGNYRYDQLDVPIHRQPFVPRRTVIGGNVWIGANSCIMGGSVIGDNAIISAGSVVHDVIPPGSIVVGNPARVIFTRR